MKTLLLARHFSEISGCIVVQEKAGNFDAFSTGGVVLSPLLCMRPPSLSSSVQALIKRQSLILNLESLILLSTEEVSPDKGVSTKRDFST